MDAEQILVRAQTWVTVKKLSSEPGHECFTEPVLRHLIFNSQDRVNSKGEIIPGNGLASAICRVGRRIYFDLNLFDRWVDAHKCGKDV
jgi:hypothetical protein